MSNPGPASSTTEHPVGGGGSPAYVGVSGGNVGFYQDPYGGGAVAQPTGNAQAAIARGSAAGMVATFSATNSPASVATLTTVELGITLVGGTGASVTIASGDILYINKPTAQAGLGVGNCRLSSAGVIGVSWSNLSAGFLTPTASETYGVVALRGFNVLTTVLTPSSVAKNTVVEQTFSVTGVRSGELLQVSKATVQAGLEVAGVRVVSDNTIGISFMNVTGGALTPTAAETYTIISLGGIDAANNEVMYQVTAAPAGLVGLTSASRGLTLTNLAATDIVTGVQKPTVDLGLVVSGGFVSAAGSLGVVFANVVSSGTLTPTANQVYGVKVWRPNPVAPLVIYSATLTPASIAANTTAEQSFTVTGLITTTMGWANFSGQQTTGVGLTGVRVTGTNNIGLTFANPTAGALTPASGTYIVGNFQMPIDAPGNSIIQSAVLVTQQTAVLANKVRTDLVAMGLQRGS